MPLTPNPLREGEFILEFPDHGPSHQRECSLARALGARCIRKPRLRFFLTGAAAQAFEELNAAGFWAFCRAGEWRFRRDPKPLGLPEARRVGAVLRQPEHNNRRSDTP